MSQSENSRQARKNAGRESMPSLSQPDKARRRRRKFWASGITVATILVIATPLMFRASRLMGLPDIGEPFDRQQFGTIVIDDADNAFVEYNLAEPTEDPSGVEETIRSGWTAVTPDVASWLDANQAALELLKRGAAKSLALNCQPKDQHYSTMISVTQQRALSRLALLEAARITDKADWEGAWQWHRTAMRHSRHVGMCGAAIDRLSSAALHSLVCEAILNWAADTRVDTRMLRQALRDVRDDYALTLPTSTSLRSEYFYTMNTLDEKMQWNKENGPGAVKLFLSNEPELGQRVIKLAYANWLAQVDLPMHHQRPRCPGKLELFDLPTHTELNISASRIEAIAESSPIASSTVGRGLPLGNAITREQCRHRQMEVTLAAQAYFRDVGVLPESPSLLLDGYLESWPVDPFMRTESPMRYHRNKNGAVVIWSVGPNEVDDGGKINAQYNAADYDYGILVSCPE